MNTFVHEKAQFASSQKGIPVSLAHTPADRTGNGVSTVSSQKSSWAIAQLMKGNKLCSFWSSLWFLDTLGYPGAQQVILAKQKRLFHSASGPKVDPNFPKIH